MKRILVLLQLLLLIFLFGCVKSTEPRKNNRTTGEKMVTEEPIKLTLKEANTLASLPLAGIQNEYPNSMHHVMSDKDDYAQPHVFHPAFYGCFDWHSAVHGHWSLVRLLKEFPNLDKAEEIKQKLSENISKENILKETEYFEDKDNSIFERTYGWAWILKLAEELHTWNDPFARKLEANLQPLTNKITQNFIDYLPKLKYPVRVGEHDNTAFALTFAWDYANTVNNEELKNTIATRARDYYLKDKNCPLSWEPGGSDFLSPCLEEIDLMRRVLPQNEFDNWMTGFAPQIKSPDFDLAVGEIADRSDGKLVHLDGLNFSRAWVMYGLAKQYPEYSHLINIANKHVNYSLPNLVGDTYMGSHWLGTFAIYALEDN